MRISRISLFKVLRLRIFARSLVPGLKAFTIVAGIQGINYQDTLKCSSDLKLIHTSVVKDGYDISKLVQEALSRLPASLEDIICSYLIAQGMFSTELAPDVLKLTNNELEHYSDGNLEVSQKIMQHINNDKLTEDELLNVDALPLDQFLLGLV